MKENQRFSEIRLDGGNLSLDFVNTIHDRYEEPIKDYLRHYPDLVGWAHFSKAITGPQKERLLQQSREYQREAEQIYQESKQLREAIYDYIVSLINQGKVHPDNTRLMNQWLSKAFSNLELIRSGDSFELDWKADSFGLESVLWPIIKSFTDLITSDARGRIRLCPNCGWAFVDRSKNSSRRWCSMETCGNREKARRHAKKKAHN